MRNPRSPILLRPAVLCLLALAAWSGLAAAISPAASSLMPDAPGWKKAGQAGVYGPANLYEYIDGAAELYLSFGFEELAVQNYENGKNTTCCPGRTSGLLYLGADRHVSKAGKGCPVRTPEARRVRHRCGRECRHGRG